jgi:hypothetical protein
MDVTDLKNRFTYHPPKEPERPGPLPQRLRYEEIRGRALQFAEILNSHCPDSRELELAITKIEEAVFWANAAIARNE